MQLDLFFCLIFSLLVPCIETHDLDKKGYLVYIVVYSSLLILRLALNVSFIILYVSDCFLYAGEECSTSRRQA